jgi:transposase-like protein
LQYFYFRKHSKAELSKFEKLARNNFEQLQKESELRENNLQSIVDQQQRVLEELKRPVEEKTNTQG